MSDGQRIEDQLDNDAGFSLDDGLDGGIPPGGYSLSSMPILPIDAAAKKITVIKTEEFLDVSLRPKAIKNFCRAMCEQSYCVLKLDQQWHTLLKTMESTCSEFFQQPASVKQQCAIAYNHDVGYLNTDGVKEFFQMRMSNFSGFPWPSSPSEFQEVMTEFFNYLQRLGAICMHALAIGLKIAPEKLETLLDKNPLDDGHFSNNILSIYHYYSNPNDPENCKIHKDMGFLTFVPRSAIAGLQVLDYKFMRWVEIEKIATEGDIIVFCGETLERLTAAYFAGCIHRVMANDTNTTTTTTNDETYSPAKHIHDRLSVVFKVRPRPDAILDPLGLDSSVMGRIPHAFEKPVSVADYIKAQLSYRESVNFPNKDGALQSYTNCILNPDLNREFKPPQ